MRFGIRRSKEISNVSPLRLKLELELSYVTREIHNNLTNEIYLSILRGNCLVELSFPSKISKVYRAFRSLVQRSQKARKHFSRWRNFVNLLFGFCTFCEWNRYVRCVISCNEGYRNVLETVRNGVEISLIEIRAREETERWLNAANLVDHAILTGRFATEANIRK